MRAHRLLVVGAALSALVTLLGVTPASAQTDPDAIWACDGSGFSWGVGPTFLAAPGGRKVGVRGSLGGCTTGHTQANTEAFPRSHVLRFQADVLALADRSLRVPDANTARFSGGLSWSLSKPGPRAPRNLHPDSIRAWTRRHPGPNWGFAEVALAAGYESSAEWDEHLITLGLDGRWAINAGDWRRILPSLVARLDLVQSVRSDARDAAGLGNAAHGRWSLRAYWNTKLDFLADALANLRFQADGSLYRTFGLDEALVNAGWNSGEHATASLRWVGRLGTGAVGINSVYARYSIGRWPTEVEERDAFSAGVNLYLGR